MDTLLKYFVSNPPDYAVLMVVLFGGMLLNRKLDKYQIENTEQHKRYDCDMQDFKRGIELLSNKTHHLELDLVEAKEMKIVTSDANVKLIMDRAKKTIHEFYKRASQEVQSHIDEAKTMTIDQRHELVRNIVSKFKDFLGLIRRDEVRDHEVQAIPPRLIDAIYECDKVVFPMVEKDMENTLSHMIIKAETYNGRLVEIIEMNIRHILHKAEDTWREIYMSKVKAV